MSELMKRIEALERDIKNVDCVSPEVGLSLIAVIKRAVEQREENAGRSMGASIFKEKQDAELLKILRGDL